MGGSIPGTRRGYVLRSGWSHCYYVHSIHQDMEQRQICKLRPNRRLSKCTDGIDVRIDLLYWNEDLLNYSVFDSNDHGPFSTLRSWVYMCVNI